MSDVRLTRRLEEVVSRLRRVRRQRSFTLGWALAAIATAVLIAGGFVVSSWLPVLLLPLVVLTGAHFRSRRSASDPATVAQLIEQRYPDLDAELLTAVGLKPDLEHGQYSFLQDQVISDVLTHSRREDWRRAVSAGRLWLWRMGHLGAFSAFVVAVVLTWRTGSDAQARHSIFEADRSGNPRGTEYAVTVDPGDVELERGSSLLVMARFDGALPSDVELVTINNAGDVNRVLLAKSSLDDPVFGGRLAEVNQDLTYHVEFAGEQSDVFHVTTFVYPELLQADATIVNPEYTGLGEKTIEDVRRFSVVEGSTVTLTCQLNKAVATSRLQDASEQIALTPQDDSEETLTVTLQPRESRRLTLLLIDEAGRQNREPPEFFIEVIPNEPPQLAVEFPARDTRVSPLEEVSLQASAQDDYGLSEYGLVYQTPSGEEETLVLGDAITGEESIEFGHLLSLEDMQVSPHQLISYFFYADDIGPDGEARRTFSDMFFAEVRHFDEEYRQMPFQQGQPQEGGQAGKLLELQRQVVTATWNTIRMFRTTPEAFEADPFVEDVGTLAEAQLAVMDLSSAALGQLTDPVARQFLSEAIEHMEAARRELSAAERGPSIDPLPDARLKAQDAYQALLKLEAREHLIQQAQQGSSAQQASNRNNRQLDQLELKNDRNRYEQENQAAQEQQQQENREQLQVLNRLRELARRQEDLNERIRELENKLRDADEDEREELERQLQRLQEEQQELLRDVEELQERMNRPENRSEMAEARRELEQTRENVRRASEALEEGQTSQALTSGTRAQRELEEMRDDFRRESANEFSDVVQELRDDARELLDRETELAERLQEDEEPTEGQRSLRDPEANDLGELADAFNEQREDLSDLLERMREVVEQSESSEPLLAEQLYETIRDTRIEQPEEALQVASEWLRRGFPQQVPPVEEQARRGIERIRDGIEQAADSVLGDDLEGLRRASAELDALTRAIENELAQADPEFSRGQPGEQQPSERPGEQPGQQPGEQPGQQPGEQPGQQPGEQPGQQPGQQPGEQPGQQPGQQPGEQPGQQPGQQPGEQPGQQPGQQPGEQPGQQPGQQPGRQPGQPSPQGDQFTQNPFFQQGSQGGGSTGPHMPLTGNDFVDWSDRMRDIEEMLPDGELRGEVAEIRERARAERIEVRRHSEQPNWELVRTEIYGRMLELQNRLEEEIARRSDDEELVPIDRDPVPDEFADLVREYYERLGRGRTQGR